MANNEKIKINDRVKRLNGSSGCHGVVKDVRIETSALRSKIDEAEREKASMVCVQWDNGTQSFFAPEALELVK